jgi:arabinose-5-phosphate isomerase
LSEGAPKYDVVGTGSMVVDAIRRAPRHAGVDEKVLLQGGGGEPVVRRFMGGVLVNQLGWARILGLRVAIFGKQAEDANGAFLRAGLERLGIEHHLDLSGSASSFADVYIDSEGRRSIYMARGATAELSVEDIEQLHRPLIEAARVVSTEVSQVPLPVVRRVLELGRAAGALTALDLDVPLRDAVPALGSEEDLRAILGLADLLKPSLGATAGLVASRDPVELGAELARRYGAQQVAVTLGEAGCILIVDGEALQVPAPKVEVRDSTGAGDAFLGGLLAGLRLELDWTDAARLANACGAACCERLGAFPDDPLACRARVLELYEEMGGGALELPEVDLSAAGRRDPVRGFLATATGELETVARRLDPGTLDLAVALIMQVEGLGGRVHVTGVGKPEHAAHYAAALLASTGTPATFLHATEATHGSIGQLRAGDALIAISNSGQTRELLDAVEAARALDARVIAVTGDPASPLARAADLVLDARVDDEGGPLGLAPRASFLAEVLVLAALSVALQSARSFGRDDYSLRHPAGELGKKSSR